MENVCILAGVGKTFIYDKRRPELTRAVLAARTASQSISAKRAEGKFDNENASWRAHDLKGVPGEWLLSAVASS